MKKKGFTLIELMIVVAIIGILAAIAIPNFLKFQGRAKQGEAKANLKSFFTTQRSSYQEKDKYVDDASLVGFNPERGNRYAYFFGGATTAVGQNRSGVTVIFPSGNGAVTCISADTFKFPTSALFPTYGGDDITAYSTKGGMDPPTTVPGGLAGTCPGCEISAMAAANIDNETDGIDSWFVATKDAVGSGNNCNSDTAIPAGTPYNTYNDVDCP
jgi:type IV pilus assembly protein PilA